MIEPISIAPNVFPIVAIAVLGIRFRGEVAKVMRVWRERESRKFEAI